jgi:hypothetical protein
MNFLKRKYYLIVFVVFFAGIFLYQYFFVKNFKSFYNQKGLYTIGKIKDVKGYGRGTGFNYIYTFNLNGRKYESVCDIGSLSYGDARKKINNNFLVIYLKNDVYNNRIYSKIPIGDTIDNSIKLKEWINSNSKIKYKIDSIIPSPGYFFQNYF